MKRSIVVGWLAAGLLAGAVSTHAQSGDARSLIDLPIPIGQPVIYGQVTLRGLPPGEPKPTITVSLLLGGVSTDRTQTNDRGVYYFLKSPNNGAQCRDRAHGFDWRRR
jgi:hypothetical protein